MIWLAPALSVAAMISMALAPLLLRERLSLDRLRPVLLVHPFLQTLAAAIFCVGLRRATGWIHWVIPVVLLITALLAQLEGQITAERIWGRVRATRWDATVLSLRFAGIAWLGLGLLLALFFASGRLLTEIAKRLDLNEVNRQLFVWLKAPMSLLFRRLIMELAAARILRLQMPTRQSADPAISERIGRICEKHSLPAPAVHAVLLEDCGAYPVQGIGSDLFISRGIAESLSAPEFEFAVLREQAWSVCRHRVKRLLFTVAVSAVLVFPYLLAVQFTPHLVSMKWILPAWLCLFLLLFIVQNLLIFTFTRAQDVEKNIFALSRMGLSPETARSACWKLAALNGPRPRLPFIPALPAPPPVAPPPPGTAVPWSPMRLGRPLGALAAFAALTAACAFLFLKPRFDLRAAAFNGDAAKAEALLKGGLSPNSVDIISNGQTPLIAAAQRARPEIMKLLLDRGANPNQFNPLGLSPLLLASEKGAGSCVKMLVEAGGNVNFKGYRGLTPLMLAAVHGHLPIAAYLLSHGAQIDARSKHQSTALLLAVQAGQLPMAVFLMRQGADLQAMDADGDSALGLARKKGIKPLIELFSRQGASKPR